MEKMKRFFELWKETITGLLWAIFYMAYFGGGVFVILLIGLGTFLLY
jgi:hypothetical protein